MPPQEVKLFYLEWDAGVSAARNLVSSWGMNADETLREACETILKQTHPDLKVIKAEMVTEHYTIAYIVHAIHDYYANLEEVSCDT
jgi:hemerythrin-like domain-containing protein